MYKYKILYFLDVGLYTYICLSAAQAAAKTARFISMGNNVTLTKKAVKGHISALESGASYGR